MAENKIKQGQLITPFGIGEMADLPGDLSVIVAGTPFWDEILEQARLNLGSRYDEEEFSIRDERRLAKFLGVDHFKLPPVYRQNEGNPRPRNSEIRLPSFRFPQLHYCLECGRIERLGLDHIGFDRFGRTTRDHRNKAQQNCQGYFVPLRFVAVCAKGHMQDIPLNEWVHSRSACTSSESTLWYSAKGGADNLGGIKITCSSCNTTRSLAGITSEWALTPNPQGTGEHSGSRINYTCRGVRPWLKESISDAEGCGEPLHVLIKGASNTYFPVLATSLFLPLDSDDIEAFLETIYETNQTVIVNNNNDNDGAALRMIAMLLYNQNLPRCQALGITETQLKDYFYNRLNPQDGGAEERDEAIRSEHYRFDEFRRLTVGNNNSSELKTKEVSIHQYTLLHGFPRITQVIDKVILVEKLRETRALVGFSRYTGENSLSKREKMQFMRGGSDVTWLPANIVKGEGIFIKFNDEELNSWAQRSDVLNYFGRLDRSYQDSRTQRQLPSRIINPKFVAIHTISHLLINKLCFNCGYGSSSLKERIYCNLFDQENEMNGVLIYTASGDSEGSLGGLVKQGQPGHFERIILQALEDSKWCSADPVCSSLGNQSGQGPDNNNGAACHNCCLVPETSCEEFNILLDRSLLTGTILEPRLGLFLDY